MKLRGRSTSSFVACRAPNQCDCRIDFLLESEDRFTKPLIDIDNLVIGEAFLDLVRDDSSIMLLISFYPFYPP